MKVRGPHYTKVLKCFNQGVAYFSAINQYKMLEGLATWFLNNYLGKYLENLNTDQLSIALLQGEVELKNVPLRRDALRFVDTAIDVRSGLVGRIKLKIPVSRLRSEPWSIVMEKVYIVIGPQKFEDYDEVKEDDLALEIKFTTLLEGNRGLSNYL